MQLHGHTGVEHVQPLCCTAACLPARCRSAAHSRGVRAFHVQRPAEPKVGHLGGSSSSRGGSRLHPHLHPVCARAAALAKVMD